MGHAVGGVSVACKAHAAQEEATETSEPVATELTSDPEHTELTKEEEAPMLIPSTVSSWAMSTSPHGAVKTVLTSCCFCASGSRSRRQMGQNLHGSPSETEHRDTGQIVQR